MLISGRRCSTCAFPFLRSCASIDQYQNYPKSDAALWVETSSTSRTFQIHDTVILLIIWKFLFLSRGIQSAAHRSVLKKTLAFEYESSFKGGYAYFNMYIFPLLIDWPWPLKMHFVKFHPEVASCLLSRSKRKYAPLGMRLLWNLPENNFLCSLKLHKKLFSGLPINFTFFVVSPKLQRIWSRNFGFATRKIWAFIWYKKMYYFWLSPGGWECDQHKVL